MREGISTLRLLESRSFDALWLLQVGSQSFEKRVDLAAVESSRPHGFWSG